MVEKTFIDTAIPWILIAIVIFWIWSKFGDKIKNLIEWIKEQFRSRKGKEPKQQQYEYIDYQ